MKSEIIELVPLNLYPPELGQIYLRNLEKVSGLQDKSSL
jgi:hypothetical protein